MILSRVFKDSVAERLRAIRSMPAPIPKKDRVGENIKKASDGSFVSFNGKTYRVTAKSKWGTGDDFSTELSLYCLNDGSTPFLEYWDDLGLKASLSDTRLTLRDLSLSPSDLKNIEKVQWQDKVFDYEDDYETRYTKPGQKKGEAVYVYVYCTRDGQHSLSVQCWSGEVYDCWVSHTISPGEVEVLVLS